jgi:hypothetical protein
MKYNHKFYCSLQNYCYKSSKTSKSSALTLAFSSPFSIFPFYFPLHVLALGSNF